MALAAAALGQTSAPADTQPSGQETVDVESSGSIGDSGSVQPSVWNSPGNMAGPENGPSNPPAGQAGPQSPATIPSSGPASTGPASSAPAKDDGIAVSFNNMPMEQVAIFLSEKLDKPVMVAEGAKGKQITVISKKKMPLPEALNLLREAMLIQGVMIDEQETLIRIRPVSEALQAKLQRVGADCRVCELPDPLAIVVKEFSIRHYDVNKMVQVIQPMLSSWGQILADPDSRKVVVTDSVGSLMRIEVVVEGMDVPTAERTLTEIIHIANGDAGEIVAIVRWLIAGRLGVSVNEITTAGGTASAGGSGGPGGGRGGPSGMPPGMSMDGMPPGMGGGGGRGGRGGSSGGATPSAIQIEPSKTPVTLMPHISRNCIIVVAPADLMPQIRTWITELDEPREAEKDYELLDVQFADTTEIAQQMAQTLSAMPNAEIRDSTHVVPFGQSKKVIVFGSRAGRNIVRDLMAKLDVQEADKRNRKTFTLKYADAEEMATRIETLFSNLEVQYRSSYGSSSSYSSYRARENAAKVTVVPDKRRNTITVITDSATMKDIEDLLAEEDKPIEVGDVKPRVYELMYADPGEVQTLLSEMFSGKQSSSGNFWDMYFGSSRQEIKPIGRLLGQFTFQVLPSSRKLIVNSTSATNFSVIDELIQELDRPQRAGLPDIVELKFANAEDLCEQVNAILSEPGTLASIRRADRGLADYRSYGSMSDRYSSQSGSPEVNSQPQQQRNANPEDMNFWWQSFRPAQNAVPSSNLIGKIRVVPVYRRNAVMVLAPEGYREGAVQLIADMDQPGRQVVIKARVGEIQHDDQTTLGLRIASDPSLLAAADSAIGGGATADYEDVFGGTLTLGANANVAALLNLLIREFDMRVLLEPALTTSENEASEYFIGQDVPIQTQTRQSSEGTSTVTDITYQQVGTRIRVRPHITQNGNVDLMINLEISRIVPGVSALGNFIFDRREVTTHVVVNTGQTIMLSGIIQQEDFDEVHKVPLLGQIPGLGKLFRSIDRGVRNRELVMFVTPVVMSTSEEIDKEMAGPMQTLIRTRESMRPNRDGTYSWEAHDPPQDSVESVIPQAEPAPQGEGQPTEPPAESPAETPEPTDEPIVVPLEPSEI